MMSVFFLPSSSPFVSAVFVGLLAFLSWAQPTVGSTLPLAPIAEAKGGGNAKVADNFRRDQLVAWCIVPFDAKNRTPEDRAAMLKELGIKEFAYDWRAEHIPTFDREVDALNKAGIHLRAFWFPAALNGEAKAILDLIERRKLDCELWITMGDPAGKTQAEKVANAIKAIEPIAAEAKRLNLKVGLYNHGGWFGEPENQLEMLAALNQPQVGMIYNLHHGHDQVARLATILAKAKDKILCLNLNGMDPEGDKVGRKILQMGQGSLDAQVLEIVKKSRYRGPIGVLGHTSHDARLTLLDNLDGLEWLLAGSKGAKPTPRTPVPAAQKPKPPSAPGASGTHKILLVPQKGEHRMPALTVQWRGQFAASEQFQVLVANGPKSSPHHWEIFQRPGSGQLAVYLPGCIPDHIETDFLPEPGKTHTIALRLTSTRGEVSVDGKTRGLANLATRGFASGVDQLAIGGLVEGALAAQGKMSWLSIRRGWADLIGDQAEPKIDADTLGLWRTVQQGGASKIETVFFKVTAKASDDAVAPMATAKPAITPYDGKLITTYLAKARSGGNAARGAALFQSEKLACISCHQVETKGGKVGPELTKLNICLTPDKIVESLIWPQKEVKPEFKARAVTTVKGRIIQGYLVAETKDQITLKEATTQTNVVIPKGDIEESRDIGSLMPIGLFESMSETERADMVAFLLSLGGDQFQSAWMAHAAHGLAVVKTPVAPGPIDPADWPNATAFANRERLYDFYQKQALQVLALNPRPGAVQAYPGLDQGLHGHWGNQNEDTWRDGRWNEAALGHVLSGVCRQGTKTIAKAVAVFLDDAEGHSVVFNPETLQFDLAWKGGFVRFSDTRHGFMDGLIPKGRPIAAPAKRAWPEKTVYRGFQRVGKETAFVLESQGEIWLDCCRVKEGKIERITLPRKDHPLAESIVKNPPLWPERYATQVTLGSGAPYAVDTIQVPFDNGAKSPMFFGDLDFLPSGDILVCTMQGEVWRVGGFGSSKGKATWRKVASGIHQPLGLKVVEGVPHLLGRDQITRLVDSDGDGEYDYHECFANCWTTSPSGHDYICGLERDDQGRFITASSNLGVMRIAANGQSMEVLATGFRNPDGIGLNRKGQITVPCSEGEWTPTSMICQIRKGGFYGYGGPRGEIGPKGENLPDLPMVYLPRGLDNSAGAQTEISSAKWGPLEGLRLHFSFGACAHFLLLDDEVDGQPQGAIVPLAGDFQSGVHRGRFSPQDGQLYVTGMQGWGSYAAKDGCLQRVRYAGGPAHQPMAVRAHANGIFVQFSEPVDPVAAKKLGNALVMAWNYRYGPQYGSPEFLVNHPQTKGHEIWNVEAIHCLSDPRQLFLEIPTLQRANQIQLHLEPWQGETRDLFLTVHNLRPDFEQFAGYQKRPKTFLPHSIAQDIRLSKKAVANPWKHPRAGARKITVQAGANLSFSPNFLTGKAGEVIALEFANPDAVPHNWALIAPNTLAQFGDGVNRQIADPDAFARQYIPDQAQVVAYTDVVQPQDKFTIYFTLPTKPGRYPFVCSFPGHWMVMNGVFAVNP